ncbi:MAG: recombinase RecA [Candidatus Sungbacteria bacterium]|nr:recombinase RecA [Candidatus Sungbacteria bacterium]
MKKTTQTDKKERIAEALKEIQSRYGEGSIMRLGEMPRVPVEIIPTGSFSLDQALGVGGIPRGRVIEIFGPESSGKTTLALHIVREAQKTGGVCAYVDAEHALDPEYAKRIGVNLNDLVLSQPDTGEQALEIVESIVRSGAFDAVVIDSVAALTPQAEIEGDMSDQHVGIHARLMAHALRKLTAIVAKTKTAVIFINQIRMQIGIRFGNPETTPGGKALKFFSSVRLDVRRIAQLKKGEEVIGNRVRAKVVKNKVAPPFRTAEFDLLFNEGISYEGDILNRGVLCGLVKKSGASFSYENVKLGVGYDTARLFLKEHEDIKDQLKKALIEKLIV